jgi:predicted permease
LSVVVLVAAALFGQTLRNLALIDPGFERERVLIASLDPSGRTPQEQTTFYERLLSDVRASPGVVSAALSASEPMSTSMGWSMRVRRGGTGAVELVNSWVATVSSDYFKTMGIPILRGTDRLRGEGVSALVSGGAPSAPWSVLVNETFVTRFLGDQEPIGAQVMGNGTMTFEIVGVVKDSATIGIRERHEPVMYVANDRPTGTLVLHVRAAVPPAGLIKTIEDVVQRVASDVPIFGVRTIDQQIDRLMGRERTFAQLTSIFGALALLLSAVGLYGLIAYAVSRRTKELGIRVALGAEPARIMRMVLREATLLITIGLAVGVPLAAGLAGTITSLLYGVQPGDWRSLTSAVAVLLAVALLAAWVPARRAGRVDPLVALRHE